MNVFLLFSYEGRIERAQRYRHPVGEFPLRPRPEQCRAAVRAKFAQHRL